MQDKINIFDRKLLRKNRQRFAQNFSNVDFLHQEFLERIIEKISDFSRNFDHILEISTRNGKLGQKISEFKDHKLLVQTDLNFKIIQNKNFSEKLIMDDEFLSFKEQSFDLIISNLNLHFINDIENNLYQINNILKKDGLFIASFFGGETLKELRQAFYLTEMENYQAISPRIIPFIDIKDAGILMQKAGFIDVVSEIEKIDTSYKNPLTLLRDLQNMGEANILFKRSRKFLTKKMLFNLERLYQDLYSDSEGVKASFEIITVIGRKS